MLTRIDTTGYSKNKVWCGPAAVAAITGVPIKTATELLVSVCRPEDRNYMDLEGVTDAHMTAAFGSLGYTMVPCHPFYQQYEALIEGPSLKRYFNERPTAQRAATMLVTVPGHYLTTHLGYAMDNWTMRPVPVEEFPKLGRRVKQTFIVQKNYNRP